MKLEKLSKKNREKYSKTLEIAYQFFLKYGYEKTNLQMIVKETKGSLATIYKIFGNKRNLFQEVIEQKNQDFFCSLEKIFTHAQSLELSLEDFIILIGKKLLNEIFTPDAIALNRLIFVEGYNNSELLDTFKVSCIDKTLFYFSKYLETYAKKEKINIDDIQETSRICVDLLISHHLLDSLLDSNYIPPSEEEIDKIAKKATKIFLLYLNHNKEIQ
ncbi:TetR/AcrR family transcriptional regulator [Helicobacter pullorum]